MLKDIIHENMISAWKAKRLDEKQTLSLVYGQIKNKEIELHTSALSDADVIQVIQKQIKVLTEEKDLFGKVNNIEKVENLQKEIELLETYLPKQLDATEIRELIESEISDFTIPNIMKHFKEYYNGQCDMKLVSQIAKEYIK